MLEKRKLIKTERPSKTKIKVSFTVKKVLYFKESFKFQSEGCVYQRKYYIISLKEL